MIAIGINKALAVEATFDECRRHKIVILLGAINTAFDRSLCKVWVHQGKYGIAHAVTPWMNWLIRTEAGDLRG